MNELRPTLSFSRRALATLTVRFDRLAQRRGVGAAAKRAFGAVLVFVVGCASPNAPVAHNAASESTVPATQFAAPTIAPALNERTYRRPSIEQALAEGVAYLKKSQNPDGSWGTGTETRGLEIYSMVPGSHDAYRVATTALCVMALREAGEKEAHDKGLEYLITKGVARRDNGSILYNIWAHLFALQALSEEITHGNKDPRLESAAREQLDRLNKYATYAGGWNYYDFNAHTQQPSLAATSFGTAAALVALWQAKEAGVTTSQVLIDRSMRRVEDCRLPIGVYTYGADDKLNPRMPANMVRGAIGRTQPCNDALWLWGSKKVGERQAVEGLELFFKEHIFLDMGRKRPYPHEAWYQTSGYYYYFDHYYAGRMLERLKPADRERFGKQLLEHVMPHQEMDGSWWDYAMWDYHKPYGTAFAVMTLMRCK